jgi:hypothetical protein
MRHFNVDIAHANSVAKLSMVLFISGPFSVQNIENNIRFNASKCKVLIITRKKTPVTYDYKLGTESLT